MVNLFDKIIKETLDDKQVIKTIVIRQIGLDKEIKIRNNEWEYDDILGDEDTLVLESTIKYEHIPDKLQTLVINLDNVTSVGIIVHDNIN
jgi:hypothetical protein